MDETHGPVWCWKGSPPTKTPTSLPLNGVIDFIVTDTVAIGFDQFNYMPIQYLNSYWQGHLTASYYRNRKSQCVAYVPSNR
jgi:hypothetical protein